jgi:hypothetical protein
MRERMCVCAQADSVGAMLEVATETDSVPNERD